jgi:diadenylate cyclase
VFKLLSGFSSMITGVDFSVIPISQMRATDIIDISLVALVVYKIIGWVKETRTWTLFKGVFVLVMISLVAGLLNLHTIAWISQYTFSVGIIAIIVLFQPELRKALEQIGGKNLIYSITGTEKSATTDEEIYMNEIVKACRIMAKSKTGALVVIQRNIALKDYENTGVLIDAAISSQLLINIFENNTPLHDGAVIINQKNRISAASCILPLTQVEIGQKYGTRHRAAVGTSEITDAIVLIVSEETGYINLAKDGKLYKNLSDDKLMDMILLKGQENKKSILIRKVFGHDKKTN